MYGIRMQVTNRLISMKNVWFLIAILIPVCHSGGSKGNGPSQSNTHSISAAGLNKKKASRIVNLEKLKLVDVPAIKSASAFLDGAATYGDGLMKCISFGEALNKYRRGDPGAEGEFWKVTGEILAFNAYPVFKQTKDLLVSAGGQATRLRQKVDLALGLDLTDKRFGSTITSTVQTVAGSAKMTVVNAVEKGLVSSGKDVGKLGSFVSKACNFGKWVGEKMKWFAKYFNLPFVADMLNIVNTMVSLKRAWDKVPRDNDQVGADLLSITASVISLGVQAANLWGPVGWAVSAALNAASALMSYMRTYESPTKKAPKTGKTIMDVQDTTTIKALKFLETNFVFLALKISCENIKYQAVFVNNWFFSSTTMATSHLYTNRVLNFDMHDIVTSSKAHSYYVRNSKNLTEKVLHSGERFEVVDDTNDLESELFREKDNAKRNKKRNEYEGLRLLPFSFFGLRKEDEDFTGRVTIFLYHHNPWGTHFPGAHINTRDSGSSDDIIISDIVKMEANQMITLELHKGVDTVKVNGRLGDLKDKAPKLTIYFAKSDDPDDTLSFDEMKCQIGIDGLKVFEQNGDVCYYKEGKDSFESCQIEVSTQPRLIKSSQCKDHIFLSQPSPVMVHNSVGMNTYTVRESRNRAKADTKYDYIIADCHDKKGEQFELNIETVSATHVEFRESAQALQLFEIIENGNKVQTTLLLQILFNSTLPKAVNLKKGAQTTPYTITGMLENKYSWLAKPYDLTDVTPVYRFDTSKEKSKNPTDGADMADYLCFCIPRGSREDGEIFTKVGMGDGLDMVVLQQALIEGNDVFTRKATLVWEDILDDNPAVAKNKEDNHENSNFAWVFQYRTKKVNDPQAITRRHHFDVVLQGIELLTFQGSGIYLDLTDKFNNKGPSIDLNNWYHTKRHAVELGSFGKLDDIPEDDKRAETFYKVSFTDNVVQEPDLSFTDDGNLAYVLNVIDLGDGENTLVINAETGGVGKEKTFQIFAEPKTQDELKVSLLYVRIGIWNGHWVKNKQDQDIRAWDIIEVRRVKRLACVYKGFMRTMPKWEEITEKKCAESDSEEVCETFQEMKNSADVDWASCGGDSLKEIPDFYGEMGKKILTESAEMPKKTQCDTECSK